MTLLIGALTMGLILSLLALGVFISFRIFEFADITGEGSITLGAALASVLLVARRAPRRRDRGGARGRSAGRRDDGRDSHALRHQQAALGHPRDDGALLHQPARHGKEQRASALGAHDGHTCRGGRGVGPWVDGRHQRLGLERRAARWRDAGRGAVRGRRCQARCSMPSSRRTSAPRCRRPATTRR